jgi:putative peptidoglycan lipid II flippase
MSAKSLLRSTALVGQMTLISRVLGLVRDSAIATMFGASAASDAFFVAFKIPNLFRRLFAEGAFSQAFVPVLAGHRTASTQAEVKQLVDAVFSALGLVLLAITAVGVLAAPVIITVFAPGFVGDETRFDLSVALLRLTFPYLLFIALTALVSGVLNTYGKFALPALTPALLNISFISCTLWLAPHLSQPVYALAAAVLIGGALQLGFQLVGAWRIGMLPRPTRRLRHPGVKRILTLMGPALFGVSVAQINFLIDTFIASFLERGSISWLYYADRLMEFPLGIFGIALGTVILPHLSEHFARAQHASFSDTLDWALRAVLTLTLPSAVGLAVLAGPILSTLFEYGEFTARDVTLSAHALMAYASGLTGFIMVKVLAPGYYARQDTRTPVKIGVIAMLTNVVLCAVLALPLAHAGLALATSCAAFVNAGLLLRGLLRADVYRPGPGWWVFTARIVGACVVMAAFLWWASDAQALWSARSTLQRALTLAGLVGGGAAIYAGALWLAGLRPSHLAQPRPPL